jgi:hypothetical protein
LKICRRPRQAGVQDKEQIPGAELWGIFVVDAPPKSAVPQSQMRGWRAVDAEIGFLGANQIAVTLRSPDDAQAALATAQIAG